MKARPILFSGEMVRALLDGRKTQTRLVVKPQPDYEIIGGGSAWNDPHSGRRVMCPKGQPGDLLYAKEQWQAIHVSIDPETGYGDDFWFAKRIPKSPWRDIDDPACDRPYWEIQYAADPHHEASIDDRGFPWRPSIYMPRWASRLTLEIEGARVERVQDISEEEAQAEGSRCAFSYPGWNGVTSMPSYRWGFWELWDSINAKCGFGWDTNPWVWVIKFKVHKCNVDDFRRDR